MNFGMSPGFQFVDFANLPFPATMLIDYVRVYHPKGSKNIGCDPPDFPTAKYINTYIKSTQVHMRLRRLLLRVIVPLL